MATKRASKRTATNKPTAKRGAGKRITNPEPSHLAGRHKADVAAYGDLPEGGGMSTGGKMRRGRGRTRELMKPARSAWTNALGKKRVTTPSKPGDKTYANKVEFRCRDPRTGKEKVFYHKARAKACSDRGWDVIAYERPRPETNPKSKRYTKQASR